ncbi:phage tail tape measure protein [Bacillus sp. RC252]|uniref:phage tail tape measure protein n=1 Tax=Bacillus sp. RC252 TaxID=3156289 RepID=UPI0038357EF1
MAGPSKETVIKFKADTAEYKNKIEQMNTSNKALKQDLKLLQTEMKLTGTNTEKLATSLSSLEKQYELAKKKTKETADQLERTKKVWGENSIETQKAVAELQRAQIAEAELSNKIKTTTESLKQAKQAEAERNSESAKSKQKLNELQRAESLLVTETNKLKSALEEERVALGDSISESEKLGVKQRHLQQQLEMSARSVENLEQQLEAAKSAYGKNSAEVNKLETKLNEARTAEMHLKNEVEQTSTSLREQANIAEKTGNKLKEVGNKTKEIGSNLTSTVTPAVAGVMGITAKWASDFDSSQRQIQAALGLTAKGAENMGGIAKDVFSKGWGESLDEVNKAVIRVYQNMEDVPHEDLQAVTEDVLALSKTFDVDLNETTRGASQLIKQYGMTGEEAMDFIATGMQNGLDVSNEFTDNLAEYVPLYKQAGFASDQMLTILKNGTRDGAYNLDYVNDLVKEYGVRIQDGSKTTSDAMGQMSQSTQDMWEEFKKGERPAADVFYKIINELKGMDDQVTATQLGVSLFGVHFEDLGNEVVYSMGDATNALGETAGTMDKLKKVQEESFGQRAQKLYREFKIALEPIGKVFLELAEQVLPIVEKAIKTMSEAFSNLSPETQKTIGVIAALAVVLGPILMLLGPIITTIGGLVTSLGGLGTALGLTTASVGAAGVATGGLGAALGAAALAIAPWLVGAAAIGAAGYGIYKALNEEAIPAVDLFKDRVNIAADGTVQSVDKISESTKKVVGSYMEMSQQAGTTALEMFAQQQVITDENLPVIIQKYEDMKNQVVGKFEEKKNAEIQKTQEAFAGMKTITAEEQANISKMYTDHYEMEKAKTQVANDKIVEIWNRAKEEKRALTADENKQIQGLREVADQQAISALSKNKTEQEVIMNNLKNSKERVTAEMLSDAVTKMEKEKNEVIDKAKKTRDDRVRAAEEMKRELGSAAEGTANKMIDEANKEYREVKSKAEATKREGIDKLKNSYKDLEDQVDTSSGKILSAWDKVKRWWNSWSILPKTMTVEKKEVGPASFGIGTASASSRSLAAPRSLVPETVSRFSMFSSEDISPLYSPGILQGLPELAGTTLSTSYSTREKEQKPQPQEIKNEVTFHTVVKNDRDLDRTFEKADEWFAKRGQALNIGKGGSTRA